MKRSISLWVTLLFAALIGVAGYGVGIGVGSWYRTVTRPDIQTTEDVRKEFERQTLELKNVTEDAKRIDRLITVLLALTATYALALGLNSYFGLKQILDTAKEDSKRTLDDIHDRYPELANLQTNLRVIMSELRRVFEKGEDWTEHAYGKLTWRQRQEIINAELSFAGLEAFRLERNESYSPRVKEICQGLGRFYSSKFLSEGLPLDWQRASLYFERAIAQGSPSARLLKDFGVHFTQREVRTVSTPFDTLPDDEKRELRQLRTEAQNAFQESLAQERDEPGALFGLGWIYYRQGKYDNAAKFDDAITQYWKLTRVANWREGERKKFLADAYRNLACCRLLKGQAADIVFADLESSNRIAMEEGIQVAWKADLQADDDLEALFRSHPADTVALFKDIQDEA